MYKDPAKALCMSSARGSSDHSYYMETEDVAYLDIVIIPQTYWLI